MNYNIMIYVLKTCIRVEKYPGVYCPYESVHCHIASRIFLFLIIQPLRTTRTVVHTHARAHITYTH